jgi:hypothetical protein
MMSYPISLSFICVLIWNENFLILLRFFSLTIFDLKLTFLAYIFKEQWNLILLNLFLKLVAKNEENKYCFLLFVNFC